MSTSLLSSSFSNKNTQPASPVTFVTRHDTRLTAFFKTARVGRHYRTSPIWILLELSMIEMPVTTEALRHAKLQSNRPITSKPIPSISQPGCHLCRPANSVRALTETERRSAYRVRRKSELISMCSFPPDSGAQRLILLCCVDKAAICKRGPPLACRREGRDPGPHSALCVGRQWNSRMQVQHEPSHVGR